MKNYFSAAELSKYFGVSQGTIWRWAKDGVLPQPTRLTPKTARWPARAIELFEQSGGSSTRQQKS
jgi:prophage regulatory protein